MRAENELYSISARKSFKINHNISTAQMNQSEEASLALSIGMGKKDHKHYSSAILRSSFFFFFFLILKKIDVWKSRKHGQNACRKFTLRHEQTIC